MKKERIPMIKTVATGTLTLNVERNETGLDEDQIYDIAARANPKRGFLIVSHLIGRHVPTRPSTMRDTMRRLAERIDPKVPGPVLFLGMAETAVGLGQGVHDAWCKMTGRTDTWFIQSTRQTNGSLPVWCRFEEGHSHATSHLIHCPAQQDEVSTARTLVMVDDECSTGTTFLKAEEAMKAVLPMHERSIDVVITDWSPTETRERISLVSGTMTWEPNGVLGDVPGQNASTHGITEKDANPARTAYNSPPRLVLARMPNITPGERVTVIADGENSYDALRIAEEIEKQGAVAAVQSITRSPVHVGAAMNSRTIFTDSHGSGATCYSYNLEMHAPDRYIIVIERYGAQREELSAGTGFPIDKIHLVQMVR